MSTFQIRKYSPGSADANSVSVCVEGDLLKVVDSGETIALDDLDLDVGGHLGDRIKLRSRSTGLLLVVEDLGLLEALAAGREDYPLTSKARDAHKRLTTLPRARRNYWLKATAGAAAAVAVLYFAIDLSAAMIINHIDPQMEAQLGRIIANTERLDSTSSEAKRVQTIGTKLVSHLEKSRYKFHFFVEDDEVLNAYAAPGGYVIVNSGLVKQAETDDELAGVIAHEIGHVINRDTLKKMGHSAGLLILVGLVTSTGIGGTDAQRLADALQLGTNLESLSYSRAQETSADLTGLHLVVKAGYDGEGLISFFQRLNKEHKTGDSKLLGLLSTHPMSSERIARIRAELARLKKTESQS